MVRPTDVLHVYHKVKLKILIPRIDMQGKYTTLIQATPVTEKMWQDLMKKAINATASSMVLANKYKQMKNKVQQAQAAT